MPLVVLDIQYWVLLGATLLLFVLEAWALIDALSRKPEEFEAAGKQTKSLWTIILGVAFAAFLVSLMWLGLVNIFNMIGAVASIVYLVDVRPAIRSLTRR